MPIEILLKRINVISSRFLSKIIIRRTRFLEFELNGDTPIFNFNYFFATLLKNSTLTLFTSLGDLVVVDYPNRLDRFDVIYNLLSFRFFTRLIFTLRSGASFMPTTVNNETIQFYVKSLAAIFSSVHWLERESWDLFGVFFQDNHDLRRILTDYGFDGYPLRKDFPLTGFLEVRYDDEQRSVIYENLELAQEFRFFDFESPWQNNK
jgi:NADH:ubiquinone oxidoreductase subunit C